MSKLSPLLPSHSCSFPLRLLRQRVDPPKLPRPRGPVQERPQVEPVVVRRVALRMVRGRQRRHLVPVGRVRRPKGLDPGRDLGDGRQSASSCPGASRRWRRGRSGKGGRGGGRTRRAPEEEESWLRKRKRVRCDMFVSFFPREKRFFLSSRFRLLLPLLPPLPLSPLKNRQLPKTHRVRHPHVRLVRLSGQGAEQRRRPPPLPS